MDTKKKLPQSAEEIEDRTPDDDAIAFGRRETDVVKIEELRASLAEITDITEAIGYAVEFLAKLKLGKVVACNIDRPVDNRPAFHYSSPNFSEKVLKLKNILEKHIDEHPLRVFWLKTQSKNHFYMLPDPEICTYADFMKLKLTQKLYVPLKSTAQIAYRLDCFGKTLSNLLIGKEYDESKPSEKQFSRRHCALLVLVGEVLDHRLKEIGNNQIFDSIFKQADSSELTLSRFLSGFDGAIELDLDLKVLSITSGAQKILEEFKIVPSLSKRAPKSIISKLKNLPALGGNPQAINGRLDEMFTMGYCHRVLLVFVQYIPSTEKILLHFMEDRSQRTVYDKIINELKKSRTQPDGVKVYEALCTLKRPTATKLREVFKSEKGRNKIGELKTRIAKIVENHGCSVLWR